MATATINTVYCVQVSSGTFVSPEFFFTLVNEVGEFLLPQSVNEIIDQVADKLGASGLLSSIYGADDLYMNIDGARLWPPDGNYAIDTGDTVEVGTSVPVSGQHYVQLLEYDSGGDDDLGGFWIDVDQDLGRGQIAKLVKNESEGDAYYVLYEVN